MNADLTNVTYLDERGRRVKIERVEGNYAKIATQQAPRRIVRTLLPLTEVKRRYELYRDGRQS